MKIPCDSKAKAPTWKQSSNAERVLMCRAMLHIHGFLTEAEARRVKRRILAWAESKVKP